jgi:hypothetical protein
VAAPSAPHARGQEGEPQALNPKPLAPSSDPTTLNSTFEP